MCGRFSQTRSWSELAELYEAPGGEPPRNLAPRYNVAPTQAIPIVRIEEDGRRGLVMARWGLVPSWAKDVAIGARLINARAETAAEKPAFRDAVRRRRCLIPADGFYEWQARPRGPKQPHHIARADGGAMAFAGLWERWDRAPDGRPLVSCTILTTEANALVRPIHDRMPVILDPEDEGPWLDVGDPARLRPISADALRANPVGRRVNDVRNDDPACREPDTTRTLFD